MKLTKEENKGSIFQHISIVQGALYKGLNACETIHKKREYLKKVQSFLDKLRKAESNEYSSK